MWLIESARKRGMGEEINKRSTVELNFLLLLPLLTSPVDMPHQSPDTRLPPVDLREQTLPLLQELSDSIQHRPSLVGRESRPRREGLS